MNVFTYLKVPLKVAVSPTNFLTFTKFYCLKTIRILSGLLNFITCLFCIVWITEMKNQRVWINLQSSEIVANISPIIKQNVNYVIFEYNIYIHCRTTQYSGTWYWLLRQSIDIIFIFYLIYILLYNWGNVSNNFWTL